MAMSASDDSCAPLVMGGYDCDFVDPPPDSLQCPVCLLPFRDPNLLSCCGHKGCASCIGRIKASGHPCPLCQQPFETMLEKQLRSKVLDLRVFCSKKEEGCPWKGELRDLETHSRRACAYVEKECRYGCGRRYQRRFLRNHEMDECPQRPLEVVTQSLILKMAERIDKLEAVHDKARQEDQTKLTVFEEEQAKLSQQIQQLQVENLTLKDEKEKVTRKMEQLEDKLQQETVQRNEDKAKLIAVEQTCHKDQIEMAAKLAAIEKSHDENQDKHSRQIKLLQTQNASLQDENRKVTRKIEEVECQLQRETVKRNEDKAKLGEAGAKAEEAQVKLTTIEQTCNEDRIKMAVLEAKLAAMEKAYREDHEKHTLQIHEQRKENKLLQDEKQKLVMKVDKLEREVQQHSTHLCSLVSMQGPGWLMDTKGTRSSIYLPATIIMPQFSQHKRDDDSWYSQPFYSWPGGYKLCLCVYANGSGTGKGTHITVFIALMKGENDHQLQWPFEHDVTHGILNWKSDEKHVIKTMNFKTAPADYKERVTSKEKGLGWGYLHFLPHSSLSDGPAKDTQYLHNDCLCLQVLKSKPPK